MHALTASHVAPQQKFLHCIVTIQTLSGGQLEPTKSQRFMTLISNLCEFVIGSFVSVAHSSLL